MRQGAWARFFPQKPEPDAKGLNGSSAKYDINSISAKSMPRSNDSKPQASKLFPCKALKCPCFRSSLRNLATRVGVSSLGCYLVSLSPETFQITKLRFPNFLLFQSVRNFVSSLTSLRRDCFY